MTLLVDTSVWSLALRRDSPPEFPEVAALRRALAGRDLIATTGIILQELLQGAVRERTRGNIVERFRALRTVTPTIDDHIAAADLRNTCRRSGVQLATVDALIAALCVTHNLTLLTTDHDFHEAGPIVGLRLWSSAAG